MSRHRDAKSLLILLAQVNTAWPTRSKASDGLLGDPRHQAEGKASDHNPWLLDRAGIGVVRALDLTHDPAHGVDTYALAERLRLARDRRVTNGGYIISNRRITGAQHNWEWAAYNGSDPHTNHMHVSVSVAQKLYDDDSPWAGIEEDTMTAAEFAKILQDPAVARLMHALPWQYVGGGIPAGKSTLGVLNDLATGADTVGDLAAKVDALSAKLDQVIAALPPKV